MADSIDIMIVAPTSGALNGTLDDRFKYIADMMASRGHSVEFVTSDFEHHAKSHRDRSRAESYGFRVTLLHEPGYRKNISPARIISHQAFARSLERYLRTIEAPKVAYCAIPPIGPAMAMGKYCKAHGVRYIIDVQDLWPESFVPYTVGLPGAGLALSALARYADRAYSYADEAITVSQTYSDRVRSANKHARVHSVYLGSDLDGIESGETVSHAKGGPVRLAYIGNLGNSYDFENTFKALGILASRGSTPNLEFVVIGDGVLREELRGLAERHYPGTVFTGRLPFEEAFGVLRGCDMGINPIRAGRAASIVNKVGDYAAAGLPVINTQDQPEYRDLVESLRVGINTVPEDPDSIADAIERLYADGATRSAMGEANRKLYYERFDRQRTYDEIAEVLERDL